MTCIVAFTLDNGKIVLAGDKLGSNGYTKREMRAPKVFKRGAFHIGYTSTFRFGQLLEHVWEAPVQEEEGDMRFMVRKVIPSLIKLLTDNKHLFSDSDAIEMGEAIIVYRGKIFRIQGDASIFEEDYTSVGCGELSATTILHFLNSSGEPEEGEVEPLLTQLYVTLSSLMTGVSEGFDYFLIGD